MRPARRARPPARSRSTPGRTPSWPAATSSPSTSRRSRAGRATSSARRPRSAWRRRHCPSRPTASSTTPRVREVDKAAGMVTLCDLRVTSGAVPDAAVPDAELHRGPQQAASNRQPMTIALERLQASLAATQATSPARAMPVANGPPRIIVSYTPAPARARGRRAGVARVHRYELPARDQHPRADPPRPVVRHLLSLHRWLLVRGERHPGPVATSRSPDSSSIRPRTSPRSRTRSR